MIIFCPQFSQRRWSVKEWPLQPLVNQGAQVLPLEGIDDRAKGTDSGTQKLKEQGVGTHELDKFRLVKPMLHHIRKNQQNPNGALLWLEGPVHISNVMKVAEYERRRA